MAGETFHDQIARNKRNSILLIGVFLVLFVGLGLLIGEGVAFTKPLPPDRPEPTRVGFEEGGEA